MCHMINLQNPSASAQMEPSGNKHESQLLLLIDQPDLTPLCCTSNFNSLLFLRLFQYLSLVVFFSIAQISVRFNHFRGVAFIYLAITFRCTAVFLHPVFCHIRKHNMSYHMFLTLQVGLSRGFVLII